MDPDTVGGNWIEGILEYGSITRRAYEAIAERQNIELDYELHLPEPVIQPFEDSGLRKLQFDVARLPTSSAFAPRQRDLLGSIPDFLLNLARYRDWFEAETMADGRQVTGRPVDDCATAESAIPEVIAAGDTSLDDDLVGVLYRRIPRFSMIAAGTDLTDENPFFHRLGPILA